MLRAGEEEIRVEMSGICGSDMSGFLGHSPRRKPPLTLGHELVGRLRDGRRVVANPLMSSGKCIQCLSGAQNLCECWGCWVLTVPKALSRNTLLFREANFTAFPMISASARAVMTEPLANVVHLFRIGAPQPFFRLAIVGAGTMGALAVLVAQLIGAKDMLASLQAPHGYPHQDPRRR